VLIVRWFLLALTLVVGMVLSQEPIPRSDNVIEKPKAQHQEKEKHAAKNQRGTGNSSALARDLPARSASPLVNENASRQHDYRPAEWWLVYCTGILAAFTLGLMFYTARLWGATVKLGKEAQETSQRQAREMEKSLDIAQESADAAKESADAAVDAAHEMRRSVKIARNQFIAAHRPRLRIRNIVVKAPTAGLAARFFDVSMPVSGQLYVDNVGDGPGKIVHSHCVVFWKQGELPMEAPYEGQDGNEFLGHPILVPGAPATGKFQSEKPMGQEANNVALCNGNWHLWVMGWIEYSDENGFVRHTRFCRLWRTPEDRFFPIHDHDYDYED
jgi:hypothetical protein